MNTDNTFVAMRRGKIIAVAFTISAITDAIRSAIESASDDSGLYHIEEWDYTRLIRTYRPRTIAYITWETYGG